MALPSLVVLVSHKVFLERLSKSSNSGWLPPSQARSDANVAGSFAAAFAVGIRVQLCLFGRFAIAYVARGQHIGRYCSRWCGLFGRLLSGGDGTAVMPCEGGRPLPWWRYGSIWLFTVGRIPFGGGDSDLFGEWTGIGFNLSRGKSVVLVRVWVIVVEILRAA